MDEGMMPPMEVVKPARRKNVPSVNKIVKPTDPYTVSNNGGYSPELSTLEIGQKRYKDGVAKVAAMDDSAFLNHGLDNLGLEEATQRYNDSIKFRDSGKESHVDQEGSAEKYRRYLLARIRELEREAQMPKGRKNVREVNKNIGEGFRGNVKPVKHDILMSEGPYDERDNGLYRDDEGKLKQSETKNLISKYTKNTDGDLRRMGSDMDEYKDQILYYNKPTGNIDEDAILWFDMPGEQQYHGDNPYGIGMNEKTGKQNVYDAAMSGERIGQVMTKRASNAKDLRLLEEMSNEARILHTMNPQAANKLRNEIAKRAEILKTIKKNTDLMEANRSKQPQYKPRTWTERFKQNAENLADEFVGEEDGEGWDPIRDAVEGKKKDRKDLTGQATDNVGKFMELDEEEAGKILHNLSKEDPELAKKLKREYVTRRMSA